jgi:hypothetical protein
MHKTANKAINEKVNEIVALAVAAASSNFQVELDNWEKEKQTKAAEHGSTGASEISVWREDVQKWNEKTKKWSDEVTALTIAKIELLPEKHQRIIAARLFSIALTGLERMIQRMTSQVTALFNTAFQMADGLWKILCCICKDMKEAAKTITQAISQAVPGYKALGDGEEDTPGVDADIAMKPLASK